MFWESKVITGNIKWPDLLSSGKINEKETMSKVWVKDHMSSFLLLLSLSDMHPKSTLSITFMDRMDRFSRCRCAHAYANPLDTFE